mgnify:FL=1
MPPILHLHWCYMISEKSEPEPVNLSVDEVLGHKATTFEDVKDQSTEDYFEGNQFSIAAFERKYREDPQETYVQALQRVCTSVASVEKPELQDYWAKRWFNEIYNDWWHPAGSIMQGAGSKRAVSLSNCTTLSLGSRKDLEHWDTLESIIRNAEYKVAKCAAYRQGLGLDFSRLRPRGAPVYNSSAESQGAIHWMAKIDTNGYYVGQAGRIPAFLFSLTCTHPDIEEFIGVKANYGKIQNANISVQCTDAFYEAVKANKPWLLTFSTPEIKIGDKVYTDIDSAIDFENLQKDEQGYYTLATRARPAIEYNKEVKARALLELIARNMTANAEPGIQNIDTMIRLSNSDYVHVSGSDFDARVVSTNACCVPGSCRILTRNGYHQIGGLVGKPIDVWNGDAWSTVVPGIKGVNQTMVVVTLSDGSRLECTENHKFILADKTRVEATELRVGQSLLQASYPVLDPNDPSEFLEPYTHGFYCGDGQTSHSGSKGALLYGPKKELAPALAGQTTGRELKGDRLWVGFPKSIPDKYEVPINCSVRTKLEWLAGLSDADGCLAYNKSGSASLQIASVDERFIRDVKLMLTTLGAFSHLGIMHEARVRQMPDGKGGRKDYPCRRAWRLTISAAALWELIDLGFRPRRIKPQATKVPNRVVRRRLAVRSVEPIGTCPVVYCFEEPKNHTGCFEGIVTGQSEQALSPESLCVLSSINAGRFVRLDNHLFVQQMRLIGHSINRFLDNVNDLELAQHTYATPGQKRAIQQLRRTGAGFTNLVEWLAKQGVKYGTREATPLAEEFQKTYNYYLYESSIALGYEKGSFGLFNQERLEQAPFIQRMVALGLKFDALRNITVSSVAPTGSLSLMFRGMVTSYGIEPAFGPYFWKRTRISGKYEYFFCVPRYVRERLRAEGVELPMAADTVQDTWDGKLGQPIAVVIDSVADLPVPRATELPALDKLELMAKVAHWVDSSISTTYMLPGGADWHDTYDFILKAHEAGVKSVAAFPDRKMYGIVSYVPFKELAQSLIADKVTIHPQNFDDEEREFLKLKATAPTRGVAYRPERPEQLPCDVHQVSIQGQKWTVLIGLLDDRPYEIFGGLAEYVQIPKKYGTGRLIKRACDKGEQSSSENCYDLYLGDEDDPLVIRNMTTTFRNTDHALATRLASIAMGHGVPVETIVAQLRKDPGSSIISFNKVLARVLGKYVLGPEGLPLSDDGACLSGNCE